MTSQRVIPVEPLVAERIRDNDLWRYYVEWATPQNTLWTLCTDAEFAAHFMTAEPLEALLAAVGVAVESFKALPDEWDIDDAALWAADFEVVIAAYRAYVEATP